jgi:hypothetical protein
MCMSRLLGVVCAGVASLFTLTSSATVLPLEGRLPATPGGTDYQAYYDPNLNITWSADADINALGTWDAQMAWVSGLSIGGVNGWRLPSVDVNSDGTVVNCSPGGVSGCADNEMGYLYWEEHIRATSPGPFSNVQSLFFWSSTESGIFAWEFRFGDAIQGKANKGGTIAAWAVYSGDVSLAAVPIPPAVWLFGSGLLGLIAIARHKKAS